MPAHKMDRLWKFRVKEAGVWVQSGLAATSADSFEPKGRVNRKA